jgi:hypothetical protein
MPFDLRQLSVVGLDAAIYVGRVKGSIVEGSGVLCDVDEYFGSRSSCKDCRCMLSVRVLVAEV